MTTHRVPAGMLEVGSDGSARLLGGYSPTSGRHHFPRSEVCPYTGADDVVDATLPNTGRLWLWTAVTAPPPGYRGPVPYGFGVVELDDIGLLVITRLTEADPGALHDGQAMRLVTMALPGDANDDEPTEPLLVWAFEAIS